VPICISKQTLCCSCQNNKDYFFKFKNLGGKPVYCFLVAAFFSLRANAFAALFALRAFFASSATFFCSSACFCSSALRLFGTKISLIFKFGGRDCWIFCAFSLLRITRVYKNFLVRNLNLVSLSCLFL